MRGAIDFIVVGFEGNKFDGSILAALADAVEEEVIGVLALSVIVKDKDGNVSTLDVADIGDEYFVKFQEYIDPDVAATAIDQEDVKEVSEMLENDTAAGLLIIEHLWSRPLKEAIAKANGFLVADGRIHPDAAEELEQ